MGGIYWLAAYPKSGSTWFRIFLRNLQVNGEAPVDINELQSAGIACARNWLDDVLGFDTADMTPEEIDSLRPMVYRWSRHNDAISYHKIHDAYGYGADGEPLVSREGTLGAVYLIRNPLDVAPSIANYANVSIDRAIGILGDPNMALSEGEDGLRPQVRQHLDTWSRHALSWVDAPGLNLLVVRYEDLLQEPHATFTQAARFLRLPDEPSRIDKAIRFSEFRELAKQEAEKGFRECPMSTRQFFHRGRSGGWRELLTTEQVDRIVSEQGEVMRRFGYLDRWGHPL
jgi:hypothetical protein